MYLTDYFALSTSEEMQFCTAVVRAAEVPALRHAALVHRRNLQVRHASFHACVFVCVPGL